MNLKKIVDAKSELTHPKETDISVALSTRIRLARNIENFPFPGWAKQDVLRKIYQQCNESFKKFPVFKNGYFIDFESINDIDKQMLIERHLISPEHAKRKQGAGAIVSKNQHLALMLNEEDHLRIQVVRLGYHFKEAWEEINKIDDAIDHCTEYAFSPDLGYLTACPTNLGTGLRASAMLHLPGLVLGGQMEKVVRACNQLNLAVRGIYGEGSDATGSIFQISNQQTLGDSEEVIIKRLTAVLDTVIEQENNIRQKLLKKEPQKLFDKIGRALGILKNAHVVTSSEALNLLSLMRLGVMINVVPQKYSRIIEQLVIQTQPAHIQYYYKKPIADSDKRNVFRANLLREKFKTLKTLNLPND